MKQYLKKITPLYRLYLQQLQLWRRIRDYFNIPDYSTKRKIIISLSKKYNCSELFIETGTYMGDTVAFLKDEFNKLISIELSEELAAKAKHRFKNEAKIQIVQGDSTEQLAFLLSSINGPIVFWLDGHYSSEFSIGSDHIKTGKGHKLTPIMEELNHISKHAVKKHVILIDDARLFDGTGDYPTKGEVERFVKKYLPEFKLSVKNDIIRILPINK